MYRCIDVYRCIIDVCIYIYMCECEIIESVRDYTFGSLLIVVCSGQFSNI